MPAPKDPVQKEIWRKKLSIFHKGKIPWNKGVKMPLEFRLKMGKLSKKFWADPANTEKIKIRNKKVAEAKMGDKNPMKRLEVRKKASQSMMGRLMGNKNPSKRQEVREKISQALIGHLVSKEARSKISKNLMGKLVGERNPFFGKHHTLEIKEKSRARAIQQISSGLLRNKRTSIEIKIMEELKARKINFIEQRPLENVTVADFYLPDHRVVIYCDGSFWHKGKWAKANNVFEKDRKQTTLLKSRGYKVFRFDEERINSSAANCINDVSKYLKSFDTQ